MTKQKFDPKNIGFVINLKLNILRFYPLLYIYIPRNVMLDRYSSNRLSFLIHGHIQNFWREAYWRPYTSNAPIPAIPINKLTITVRGGSAPPIAFPDSASYLANLFFGALHWGQPYSSGWKGCENSYGSSCKLQNDTSTFSSAHVKKLILLIIWRRILPALQKAWIGSICNHNQGRCVLL